MNKEKHHTSREQGFTLIETLVAILILLSAIMAPVTLAVQSINATSLARDQVIATFLAQDAVEFIVATRKQNLLSEHPTWLHGMTACAVSNKRCTVDTTRTSADHFNVCGGSSCDPIKYNENNHFYGHSGAAGWEETKFIRSVEVNVIEPDQEAVVTVRVNWRSGLFYKTVTLKTNIFNNRL